MLLLCLVPSAYGDHPRELILLHYWTGALSGGIDEMVDAYNTANPENPVRATGFEHESFKVGINVMLDGGGPPDMFSYWAGARVEALVERNQLAPIDTTWKENGLDKTFPPSVAKACTYDGHKYALPVTQHYVALFYNVALFNRLGLHQPRTWPEFLEVCATLKKAGITPLALGGRDRWPAQFWFDYLLLRTAGADYRRKLMQGKASYEDPEVQTAFSMWKTLLEKGYFNDNTGQLDWSEASKLVYSGNAAMTLMGTWVIGLFDGQLGWEQQKDYDFFSFPMLNETIPKVGLGPIDVIVSARLGHPDKVNNVMAYFADPGPQMSMSQGSGALAPSRAIPTSFYTPMQGRIAKEVRNAAGWAFNYDLATPPAVAEMGLDAFKAFLENPKLYRTILLDLNTKSKKYFDSNK